MTTNMTRTVCGYYGLRFMGHETGTENVTANLRTISVYVETIAGTREIHEYLR